MGEHQAVQEPCRVPLLVKPLFWQVTVAVETKSQRQTEALLQPL